MNNKGQSLSVESKLASAQFFNKLADTLAGTRVILPWLMAALQVPAFYTGLLVPVRESTALLPQVIISQKIKQYSKRKHALILALLVQSFCIFVVGSVALTFTAHTAGVMIVLMVALLGCARAVASLASKDVLGKCVEKNSRGSLLGLSATLAGGIAMGLGVALMFKWLTPGGTYAEFMFAAALAWLLSAACYIFVIEPAGETDETQSYLSAIRQSLNLLREDKPFQNFVICRALLMSSSLATPYFVLLAYDSETPQRLGLLILLGGLASTLSGRIWGYFADRSSRSVLLGCSICTALLCLAGAGLSNSTGSALALFFLLSVVHQGVRLGRKTYVVDLAEGNQRTDYVATSNAAIGVLLLFNGSLVAAVAQFSIPLALLLFAALSTAGAWYCFSLREV